MCLNNITNFFPNGIVNGLSVSNITSSLCADSACAVFSYEESLISVLDITMFELQTSLTQDPKPKYGIA